MKEPELKWPEWELTGREGELAAPVSVGANHGRGPGGCDAVTTEGKVSSGLAAGPIRC